MKLLIATVFVFSFGAFAKSDLGQVNKNSISKSEVSDLTKVERRRGNRKPKKK